MDCPTHWGWFAAGFLTSLFFELIVAALWGMVTGLRDYFRAEG